MRPNGSLMRNFALNRGPRGIEVSRTSHLAPSFCTPATQYHPLATRSSSLSSVSCSRKIWNTAPSFKRGPPAKRKGLINDKLVETTPVVEDISDLTLPAAWLRPPSTVNQDTLQATKHRHPAFSPPKAAAQPNTNTPKGAILFVAKQGLWGLKALIEDLCRVARRGNDVYPQFQSSKDALSSLRLAENAINAAIALKSILSSTVPIAPTNRRRGLLREAREASCERSFDVETSKSFKALSRRLRRLTPGPSFVANPHSSMGENRTIPVQWNRVDKHSHDMMSYIKKGAASKGLNFNTDTSEFLPRPFKVSDIVGNKTRSMSGTLKPDSIEINRLSRTSSDPPVPTLAHGLDRVLFNPSTYVLQDPYSQTFNFDPKLQSIPSVEEFDFNKIPPFTSSSKHSTLKDMARKHNRPFVGSTSSLTGLLSHVYFLLSGDKPVSTNDFSKGFQRSRQTFTASARMPVGVRLRYDDGVYAIDSAKFDEEDDETILMQLGTLLEYFLTQPDSEFAKLSKSSKDQPVHTDQPYQYSLTESFVMRSQLDCYDPRLPGSGVFDIKTRAAIAIRLDLNNHLENSGYVIKTMKGLFESYEREHYDLLRSGLLKYNFQARIGNMDGIFIAFHNTSQIFGFQYMSLADMDKGLFAPTFNGDLMFKTCVGLLDKIMQVVKDCYPHQDSIVVFDNAADQSGLRVWIEPADWDLSSGPVPVTELVVTVQYLRDGKPAKGRGLFGKRWSISYQITRNPPSDATRRALKDAHERRAAIGQPPGSHTRTSEEQNAEEIMSLPISKTRARSGGIIHRLRRLAQEGRIYTNNLKLEQGGKAVKMWDSPGLMGSA